MSTCISCPLLQVKLALAELLASLPATWGAPPSQETRLGQWYQLPSPSASLSFFLCTLFLFIPYT